MAKKQRSDVFDDAGKPTGATFGVENVGGTLSVRFDSRGTTEGTRGYRAGLVHILERLARTGVDVTDVCVETRTTGNLSRAQRRVLTGARGAHETLTEAVKADGADSVRARLGSAAAKVGRPPGAKGGGNGTKRLRFYLSTDETTTTLDRWLSGRYLPVRTGAVG